MKEIKAIIQQHMLSRVREALEELPHFPGMTVTKCRGLGRGRGEGGSFVQSEDEIQYPERECLIVVCAEEQSAEIANIIATKARTGNQGDGIITISEVLIVTRIRTGQTGSDAV